VLFDYPLRQQLFPAMEHVERALNHGLGNRALYLVLS